MLKRINYDDRQHLVYVRGRALPPDVVAAWMAEFARHSPSRRPLTVLDLGSGTGRFSPALAGTFGGPVYGVEPSARMRQVAANTSAHPSVTYLQGSAEQVPLPDDHCDLILLYLVIHHIQDLPAAAPEIARVLAPGGRLLIRNAFADRMPDPLWHRLAASHADYAARLRLRASSVFDHMTEQEIAEGFATMDADLAAHPGTGPVEEDCDLLTLAVPET
ncbi:class I SAM-dependent methyltransferase [Nonomuraea angiospora]|uniref:class I SAM-dependent methyltransferase n=1 Tax=Nonomuraea angiospora TaxID=46172 RepID=UPI00331A660D